MTMRELTDHQFWQYWLTLDEEQRDALSDDDRAYGNARYDALTPYNSIEAAQDGMRGGPPAVVPTHVLARLEALWDAGLPSGDKTGWASVDQHYTVAPGQLTILTGWPGSGKSEWLDHLLINLSRSGWKFSIFSAENQPLELHIAKLIEKLAGKPFGEGVHQRVQYAEILEYTDELAQSFRFMEPHDNGTTLRGIIASATPFLMRDDGRKRGLVIDPWNELDHQRPKQKSETEYISESLSYLRTWARLNGVHVWLVAHPAKQPREEGKLPIPKPDMISGSQHWWNKADCALTVYRLPVDDDSAFAKEVEIYIQKIRFKNIGKIGKVTLNYDRITGRYSEQK